MRRRAGHRVDDGAELDDEAVAHQLDEAAAVLGQERLQHAPPQLLQGRERAGLVSLDEARVADHVGSHDGVSLRWTPRSVMADPCHPVEVWWTLI